MDYAALQTGARRRFRDNFQVGVTWTLTLLKNDQSRSWAVGAVRFPRRVLGNPLVLGAALLPGGSHPIPLLRVANASWMQFDDLRRRSV